MMQLLKIAWRNLWRNKRRTLLTSLAVTFSVFATVLLESLNEGMWDYFISNQIEVYSGHIEIQKKGYKSDTGLENAITNPSEVFACLDTIPGIISYTARFNMFVLAAYDDKSRASMLWGIEVGQSYGGITVTSDTSGIWLGENLAGFFNALPGDSVILLGQSYYGRNSAEIFPVAGYISSTLPEIMNHLIIAPINQVRRLGGLDQGATTILVTVKNKNEAFRMAEVIEQHLCKEQYQVLTWLEVFSGRMALMTIRETIITIFKLLLYLIAGFGLLGTIIMTQSERRFEYGVMHAIGMKKQKMIITLILEFFFISQKGLLAGIVITYPVISLLHYFPIYVDGEIAQYLHYRMEEALIIFSNDSSIIISNVIIVFCIKLLAILVPVYMLARLDLTIALRT